jgi:hypothetical protein
MGGLGVKIVVLSFVSVMLAGCALAGPGAPSASPSASVGAGPTASRTPTPPPSVATPSPIVTDDASFAVPPTALLVLPDGSTAGGKLGAYCYRESCSDPPFWPMAASMTAVELPATDTPLTVSLDEGAPFVAWTARYAAGDDHEANTVWPLDTGGEPDGDEPMVEATFAPPPSGEWLVEVRLTLLGNEGDISYYWSVVVP